MKSRIIGFIILIGALVFLGIPSNILSANFETDTRDTQWISNYDDRIANDFGGIFHDSLYASNDIHIAAGLHTDVYNPNDATVNHYNGLIASYDVQGNLLNSLELKGPNGSKSLFNSVIELKNGNFIAVGVNHSGTIEESGKAVIFDSNLNVISSIDFVSTQNDYTFVTFLDVKNTGSGLLITGTITHNDTEMIEMASFIFDYNLNLIEEASHGNEFQGSSLSNLNLILDNSVIGNIETNGSNKFVLVPPQSGKISSNTQTHTLVQNDGYAMDAIINSDGNIVVLVALDDGTYHIRQFDSSRTALSDLPISLDGATYKNITLHEDNTYVVSGEKNGKMHYVITDGVTSSEHTYNTAGIIENTVSLENGALVSVGYNYDSFLAIIMKSSPKYTVNFDGGEEPLSIPNQEIFKGGLVTKPADPQGLTGSFLGWFTDEKLTTPYDFNSEVNESMTLYAKWGVIEMILDHDGNIDPNLAPEDSVIWINVTRRSEIMWGSFQLQVGQAPSLTPLGQELGVKFEGYELVDANLPNLLMPGDIIDQTMVDLTQYPQGGNLVVKAVYSRPSYTVTIKDTVDDAGEAYTVYHGEKLSTLNHTPINDGFVFNGYTEALNGDAFNMDQAIVKDVTLIGNWTKVTQPVQNLQSKITWVGGSEPRPSLTLNLLANDKLVGTQTVLTGTTNVEWIDLSIDDASGNKIVYTVKADDIVAYDISYQDLDVTLTHNPTPNPNPQPPVQEEKPINPNAPQIETTPDPEVGELPQTGVANDATMELNLVLLGGVILILRKKKQAKASK